MYQEPKEITFNIRFIDDGEEQYYQLTHTINDEIVKIDEHAFPKSDDYRVLIEKIISLCNDYTLPFL